MQPGEETPALSQDYTITEADQDKTFVYSLTTRFAVELDAARHPRSQLFCEPTPIFGYISNGSNPDSSQYPVRYEITQVGECQLHSGDFKATIIAVDQ